MYKKIEYFVMRMRIKARRWVRRPKRSEVEHLRDYYRKNIFIDEILSVFMDGKDFDNLVKVARYADLGVWTAIQAAFCLGYKAGRQDGGAE